MPNNPISILKSPIPSSGKGRNLTSSECKELRKHGIACSPSMVVISICGSTTTGLLYRPLMGVGVLSSTGCRVSS